jgi:hypothetical protein
MQHQLRNYEITKADYERAIAQGTDQFARELNDTAGWRRQATNHAPGFQIPSALEQFGNFSTNSSPGTELTTEVKDSFKTFANRLNTARKAGIATLLRWKYTLPRSHPPRELRNQELQKRLNSQHSQWRMRSND